MEGLAVEAGFHFRSSLAEIAVVDWEAVCLDDSAISNQHLTLTCVESSCSLECVIRFADIERRLNQQFDEDEKFLRKNYAEQNKLRRAVLRFHDLEREAKAREERMARVIMLLGEDKFEDTRRDLLKGFDLSNEITTNTPEKLRLWMAMRAIVEQVSELQVVDLQDTLTHFGIDASRQAIESALASHKETFQTKARGREKFVSLRR